MNSTAAVLASLGEGCNSQPARHRRSVDLHQEMMALGMNAGLLLQICCMMDQLAVKCNAFFSILTFRCSIKLH